MADLEDSQQATQQVIDPRRLGRNNSGLSERDVSDVICILHPASTAALRVVSQAARYTPQHILQNSDLPAKGRLGDALLDHDHINRDIALRFSSQVKNPALGFSFGRNPNLCDFVIGNADNRRFSNMHFRIFLTQQGVLMLEDMSTNGTVVDDVLLIGKNDKADTRRMICPNSIISLVVCSQQDEVKFIVRIPSRNGGHDTEYANKMEKYFDLVNMHVAHQREIAIANQSRHPGAIINKKKGVLFQDIGPTPHNPPSQIPFTPSRRGLAGLSTHHFTGGPKYNVVSVLGKGSFACVYKVATKTDGELFAAKELSKRQFLKDGILDHKIDKELGIMKRLNHPNIVQYVDYMEEGHYMYIIMEYIPYGDFNTYLSQKGAIPEELGKVLASQMLDALAYLHASNITHRDMKPDNILIYQEDPFIFKLSDFGLSKVIEDQETFLRTFCGTLLYCAPEIFPSYHDFVAENPRVKRLQYAHQSLSPKKHSYSQSVDIWSLGAVLFMILAKKQPFAADRDNPRVYLEATMLKPLDVNPLLNRQISLLGLQFISQMLSPTPESRPAASACLEHPWLKRDDEDRMKIDEMAEEEIVDLPYKEGEPEEEAELDASQLNITDQPNSQRLTGSELYDDDDLDWPTLTSTNQLQPPKLSEAKPLSTKKGEITYPILPVLRGSKPALTSQLAPTTSKKNRLFGEIGSSVLGSSGVFPPPKADLELPYSGNPPKESFYSELDEESLYDINMAADPMDSFPITPSSPHERQQTTVIHDSNPPKSGPAASLLGAESLVGQLKMTSPSPDVSAAVTPVSTDTPHTSASRDTSPAAASLLNTQGNSPSSEDLPPSRLPEPRPGKFDRMIRMVPPPSAYWDARDPSTWVQTYPPGVVVPQSSHAGNSQSTPRADANYGKAIDNKSITSPSGLGYGASQINLYGKRDRDAENSPEEMSTISVGNRKIGKERNGTHPKNGQQDPTPARPSVNTTSLLSAGFYGSGMEEFEAKSAIKPHDDAATAPNLPIFGKLISTPDSYLNLTLDMHDRSLSWGRGDNNSHIYPNGTETSVPRYTFEIMFWHVDMLKQKSLGEPSSGKPSSGEPVSGEPSPEVDWKEIEGVRAIIRTRTPKGFWVNGFRLQCKDDKIFPWGTLYSGDVITVFDYSTPTTTKVQKFVCEFYLGPSALPRPTGSPPFEIDNVSPYPM
ncbi:MAG: hypothetical protein M1829_002390 [Trizodia sp. TS-e1964]|nr:MAG: hypothetical protein M1829_002390 [Trizodia sp. TS-e1964]